MVLIAIKRGYTNEDVFIPYEGTWYGAPSKGHHPENPAVLCFSDALYVAVGMQLTWEV